MFINVCFLCSRLLVCEALWVALLPKCATQINLPCLITTICILQSHMLWNMLFLHSVALTIEREAFKCALCMRRPGYTAGMEADVIASHDSCWSMKPRRALFLPVSDSRRLSMTPVVHIQVHGYVCTLGSNCSVPTLDSSSVSWWKGEMELYIRRRVIRPTQALTEGLCYREHLKLPCLKMFRAKWFRLRHLYGAEDCFAASRKSVNSHLAGEINSVWWR